jgi:hypothetical protein
MRVFIIRPFGVQQNIDFDRVEAQLIQPAILRLQELGRDVSGGTTGEISYAGNIREDMFRLIAISDLVIADVTIHNANAFYELGIRHALCPGHTHLIRGGPIENKYPFDLQTDRYLEYNLENPGASVERFAQALNSTLAGERDSPIFTLLRDLKPHGRGQLVKVPEDFREEVERARNSARRGDLRLLAQECQSFEWDQEGLILVGDAQFKLRAYGGARDTFELLRNGAPNHLHANWRLGTIYQRLALTAAPQDKEDLATRSDQAINRALRVAETPGDEAEQHSLLGSNAKNRWMDDYRSVPPEQRELRALESACLEEMLKQYMKAAACDLNAHYPAVNVVAFLKVQTLLARRYPDSWAGLHDKDPAGELREREELAERLVAALRLTLQLDDVFKDHQKPLDSWAASSIADTILLSTPDKTPQITKRYRDANAGADRSALEANRRNLAIFRELNLLEPGVTAALGVIDEAMRTKSPPEPPLKRVLLFTGHMVDAPKREPAKARFPRTAAAEQKARKLIYDAVVSEVGADAGETLGIAGGACGSDILFHEVCAELGIKTDLYLVIPPAEFQRESVARGGPGWETRYQELCEKGAPRVLQSSLALPNWLINKPQYTVWIRNNLWMLFSAVATGARKQTVIALFNEERDEDGPGGTKHLLVTARAYGLKTVPVDARPLLIVGAGWDLRELADPGESPG